MTHIYRTLEKHTLSVVLNGPDPDKDIHKMYIPARYSDELVRLVAEECAKLCTERNNTEAKYVADDIRAIFGI